MFEKRGLLERFGEYASVHVCSLDVVDGNAPALHLLAHVMVGHINVLSGRAIGWVVSLRNPALTVAKQVNRRNMEF